MEKVSDRLNRLSESATLAMARMSRELKAEGKDVMSQLRVVLDRIVKIVQAEGGSASDIVSMTTYIVDTKMSEFWPIEGEQKEIWDEFLGEGAPRRQIVLLDQNLEKQFQQQYNGAMSDAQKAELLAAIQDLINALVVLGDMNEDMVLNVLDVVILANMALGNTDVDLNGDMNNDGGINILDIVLLVNIILTDE